MKSRVLLWCIAIWLCAMVALSSQLTAQNNPQHHPKHHQYTLYLMGSFGGPASDVSYDSIGLTPAGFVGMSEIAMQDPNDPYCYLSNCYVGHASLWRHGVTFDLGALPGNNGGNTSYAYGINNSGMIVGFSENGAIDPDTGFPSASPVAWLNGHIFSLGGFGGTQGYAAMVNNRGQIAGGSSNTTPDDYGFLQWFPVATQMRAFVWERGRMKDLGTLGGSDAWATVITDSGLVLGRSFTSNTPNPDSGFPTLDPFLWDGHRMIDLGNLGGDISWPWWVNNQGQVVGYSLDATGTVHAFLWDRGRIINIGAPGDYSSGAFWINEAGVITGFDNLSGDNPGAALWNHGRETILGTLPGYDGWAQGSSVNNAQQVVGWSISDDGTTHAFLWENGDMVDLNALLQPSTDIVVTSPVQIDDRGEIATEVLTPSGDIQAALLIPSGYCDTGCEQRIENSRNNPHVARPMNRAITMPLYGKPADLLRNPFGLRRGPLSQFSAPIQ